MLNKYGLSKDFETWTTKGWVKSADWWTKSSLKRTWGLDNQRVTIWRTKCFRYLLKLLSHSCSDRGKQINFICLDRRRLSLYRNFIWKLQIKNWSHLKREGTCMKWNIQCSNPKRRRRNSFWSFWLICLELLTYKHLLSHIRWS